MENSPRPRAEIDLNYRLTEKERLFLIEYAQRLEALVDKLATQKEAPVRTLLQQLLRPDVWRTLLDLSKAERLTAKSLASVERGQSEPLEAEGIPDPEYIGRVDRLVEAMGRFSSPQHDPIDVQDPVSKGDGN
jgi:hypothetical protein